jgi:CRISPR-associated protein Cas1
MTVAYSQHLNTLYVHTNGSHLALEQDSVIVSREGTRTRLPLQRLDAFVLIGNVTASPQLLGRCAADGRSITWLSPSGRFRFRIQGPVGGNVLLRRAQHNRHVDPADRAQLAVAFVAGKLKNCRQVLLAAARNTPEVHKAERLREVAERVTLQLPELRTSTDLDRIRGIEGHAARMYFTGLRTTVRVDDIPPASTRTRRPPLDPLNAMLSFSYALLRTRCEGALETVGLDPQVGYLHGLRPGRSSLALDLMEELRPLVADRFVTTMLNRRQLRDEHFDTGLDGAVSLNHAGRAALLTAWQQHQDHEVPHRLLHGKVRISALPLVQARLLARVIRGEMPNYIPHTSPK